MFLLIFPFLNTHFVRLDKKINLKIMVKKIETLKLMKN